MNWWEDAESRARRFKSPADLGQVLWQRFSTVGIDPGLSYVPACDLGALFSLCADLIKLVDGLLLAADGDAGAMRRQGLALHRWTQTAAHWAEASAPAMGALLDGLELEPEQLAARDEVRPVAGAAVPEEQAKLDGRYRFYHLLHERLDLKLASLGLNEQVHRGLARSLAHIYEEALVAIRMISGLEKEARPGFRATARLLLELNTTWHYALGPYHLGNGRMNARESSPPGLAFWLFCAFGVVFRPIP